MKKQNKKITQSVRKYKKQSFSKKDKKPKMIIIILASVLLAVAVLLTIFLSKPHSVSDIRTDYHSFSVNVRQGSVNIKYKFDGSNQSQLAMKLSSTKDDETAYAMKIYFLGKEEKIFGKLNDKSTYVKLWGMSSEWQDALAEYNYQDTPEYTILEALRIIKNSQGKIVPSSDGGTTFALTDIDDPEKLFLCAESSLAAGQEFYSNNYGSIKAIVTLRDNRDIAKIVFKPDLVKNDSIIQKDGEDFSSNDYKDITWEFYDINKTKVNYEQDLWDVL